MMAVKAGGLHGGPRVLGACSVEGRDAVTGLRDQSRTGKSGFTPEDSLESASTGEKFEGIEL